MILKIIQILVAIALIILVLLQQRGTALGSSFGGGDGGGSFYSTRRGVQKKIYWATIILAIAFIVLSLINLAI